MRRKLSFQKYKHTNAHIYFCNRARQPSTIQETLQEILDINNTPRVKKPSLLSLGQLCDDECDILLNKNKIDFIEDEELILQGTRNMLDGLWDIPVSKIEIIGDNL